MRNGIERGAFLVPRRADGGERDRIWAWCRRWWESKLPEIPIFEGESPEGPFNRAAAANDAARKAEPWDYGILIDADVVAGPWQVRIAATAALNTGEVVLGFEEYHALTPAFTRACLAGKAEPAKQGRLVTRKQHESSLVLFRRDAWEDLGGMDERFSGWGQEDVAFAHAARLLRGLRRSPGEVFHLFHARTKERIRSAPTYKPNQALGKRYREISSAAEMRQLLAERELSQASA